MEKEMSRPLRLAERGSHGARVLGLRDWDTAFEPRGRNRRILAVYIFIIFDIQLVDKSFY